MRIIVGFSGSSGAIYGIRALEILRAIEGVETHLILTPTAAQTIAFETDWNPRDVERLAAAGRLQRGPEPPRTVAVHRGFQALGARARLSE